MKKILFFSFLLFSQVAHSSEIVVELTDVGEEKLYYYTVNLKNFHITEEAKDGGKEVPSLISGKYEIKESRLVFKNDKLMVATELLFEAHLDGADFLVIRYEYHSFINPLKWLAALAGHPIQTSAIYFVQIENGKISNKERVQEKDNYFYWRVMVRKLISV